MKTNTFAPHDLYAPAPAAGHGSRLRAAFDQFVAGWKVARDERRLRNELAELDTRVLCDLGIAPDEIDRVRAREAFKPRAWTN